MLKMVKNLTVTAAGCGCLEQYASATGVVRLANRYIAKNSESTKMTEFGEDITAKDVFDLAKEGDKGAVAVVEQMSTYLGKAMASIATVVNPQAFIIGGGVSKAGQYLIVPLQMFMLNMLSQLVEKQKLLLQN